MDDDLTVRILTEIRDEIRTTNQRVERLETGPLTEIRDEIRTTNQRVEGLGERVDRVEHRLVDADIRSATATAELIASTRDLYTLLADRFDLRDRMERVEKDIVELKHRVG